MKKILILSLSAMFILISCNNSDQNDSNSQSETEQTQKIIRNIEQKYANNGNLDAKNTQSSSKPQITADKFIINTDKVIISFAGTPDGEVLASSFLNSASIQDNNLFTRAIQTKNTAYCYLIQDELLKEQCFKVINDQKIIADAIGKEDPTVCEQIVNQPTRDECKDLARAAIELGNKEEQEQKNQQRQQSDQPKTTHIVSNNNWQVETQAMQQDDPSICSRIEKQEDRYECRYQVLVLRAINQKDPSICSQIGNEKWEGYCRGNVKHITGTELQDQQNSIASS